MEIPPEPSLRFMVDHIVFPPQLPQSDDQNHEFELALVELARDQGIAFQNEVPAESRSCWAGIVKMLTTWLKVNAHGSISKEALARAMTTLNLQGGCSRMISKA